MMKPVVEFYGHVVVNLAECLFNDAQATGPEFYMLELVWY